MREKISYPIILSAILRIMISGGLKFDGSRKNELSCLGRDGQQEHQRPRAGHGEHEKAD